MGVARLLHESTTSMPLNNKNVDIKFSAHDALLE
jgi:hypothetical protein